MRTRFASAVVLGLFFAQPAAAATCQVITYYSNAAQTTVVGSWSNCPGQKGLQGKRTRFSERETIEISGGPRPGGGKLPCEFLQRGCRPFERRPGG